MRSNEQCCDCTNSPPGEGAIEGAGVGAWCGLGLGLGSAATDPEMNSVLGADVAPALWREHVLLLSCCANTSKEKATQLGVLLQDSQQAPADGLGPVRMTLSVNRTPAVVAHGSSATAAAAVRGAVSETKSASASASAIITTVVIITIIKIVIRNRFNPPVVLFSPSRSLSLLQVLCGSRTTENNVFVDLQWTILREDMRKWLAERE